MGDYFKQLSYQKSEHEETYYTESDIQPWPLYWLTGLARWCSSQKHSAPGQSNCCQINTCKERSQVWRPWADSTHTHITHSKLTVVSLSMFLTVFAHFSAYPVETVGSWSVLCCYNQQRSVKYRYTENMSVLSMSANLLAALAALAALVEWLTSHILQGILVVKDTSHYWWTVPMHTLWGK